MGLNRDLDSASVHTSADDSEEIQVRHKVLLELNRYQHKMVNLGGILSHVIGFFIVLALLGKASLHDLIAWYIALFTVNLLNVKVAYRNRLVKPSEPLQWRKAMRDYHVMIGILCLTWGSLGILYTSKDPHYQLYLITYLQLLLIGFSFGTVTDYTACVISNICLLFPYLVVKIWTGVLAIYATGHDPDLNISFTVNLLLLSAFCLMACYPGYQIVKRFFRLNFENIALNKKLEHMNKFLELRVKERTVELEKSLKLVTYQATHDLLTDLPNQRSLIESIQESIKTFANSAEAFGICFLTLNELDKINDGLGYQAGDLVIQTVAQRLVTLLKNPIMVNGRAVQCSITLSRKDVFVILIQPILHPTELDLVEGFFKALEEPVHTGTQFVKISASIGVCLYPQDGKNIQTLLMHADAAMLHAKKLGGNNTHIYHSESHADISRELEIERNLHQAIVNQEFVLQYQPFVAVKTGEICGAEALIRWHSPTLGLINPGEFIGLAEANGLIIPMSEWVLHSAFTQAKAWQDMGQKQVKVAVNLSAKQFYKKGLVQTIMGIVAETKVDPTMVELELTESEVFQQSMIPILKQLKDLGFYLSIDDFGTGYSGLSNLKQFNLDYIKIDKSFVQDIATNKDSQVIVTNTIELAKQLDIQVLAEGIETKEQLDFLVESGCDIIQGYYFSRPLDTEKLTRMLMDKMHFVIA